MNTLIPRRWAQLAVAALLVSVAACGTRVHGVQSPSGGLGLGAGTGGLGPSGGAPAGSGQGSALAGGANASGAAGGGAGGSVGGGSAPAVGPAGGGTAGNRSSGASGASGASSGSRSASAARAVTATTIKIGYTYSNTATFKEFAAACPACSSFGDETYFPAFFKTLAQDLNSHGGILGRQVQFDGLSYDSTAAASDSSQLDQAVQAACTNFTQQDPTFAVVSAFGQLISPCLTKAGVSTVVPPGGIVDLDDSKVLSSSLLYAPGAGMTEAFYPVYIQRLAAMKYFSGWDSTTGSASAAPAKIGIVSFSDSQLVRADQLLEATLKADGYKIADHIWYSAELDTQSQSVQNAILKFRSEGITHVMGTGANGLFMYEGVGQNYYPRYAYQTGSVSDTDAESQKGMAGSMGVGLLPVFDIDPSQNPPSTGAPQTKCEQLGTQAGVSWQSNQGFHADILAACDAVWTLANGINKGGAITAAGLRTGIESLGTVGSPATFSETWSLGRHASANTVADFIFHTDCSCFKYTGTRTKF